MNNVEITSETDGEVIVVYLKGQALDASNRLFEIFETLADARQSFPI